MCCRRELAWLLAGSLGLSVSEACAHHGVGPHHGGPIVPVHSSGWHHGQGHPPVIVPVPTGGGGWGGGPFGTGYVGTGMVGPGFSTVPFSMIPPAIIDPGPVGGPMPLPPMPTQIGAPIRRVKRVDASKVTQLVTIGDRLFRAGNTKRASERYEQAARANPEAAAPRVRLAQIALVRGHFAEAAQQIRDAVTADPHWLANAPDIQTIYAEPADFARQIARLESRVLVDPADRDAWLVLGAELYLSGQTRRASDIFVRLSDRTPDPALAAFLDASNTPRGDAK